MNREVVAEGTVNWPPGGGALVDNIGRSVHS